MVINGKAVWTRKPGITFADITSDFHLEGFVVEFGWWDTRTPGLGKFSFGRCGCRRVCCTTVLIRLTGSSSLFDLFDGMIIIVSKGSRTGVHVCVSLNPFFGGIIHRITANGVIRVLVRLLINSDKVDQEANISLHHLTKSRVEITPAFWVTTVITRFAVGRNFIGKTPCGRNGRVKNKIGWFRRNLRPRHFLDSFISNGQCFHPFLSLSIPFNAAVHAGGIGAVGLDKPI
mmetsp:Transcript_3955/g.5107  ORF Transcript_3955/g.5107 Transcript_3955/m.5107 type:complete len:231 (+) Transcript_3955:575-1267(+)